MSSPTKSVLTCAWLMLAAMLTLPTATYAAEVRRGERVEVDVGETVDDTLVVLAQDVIIEGHVTGDLVALANTVSVWGTIDGNLVTAAERVEIEGVVKGSVLTLGQDVHVSGLKGSQLYAVGRDVTLDAVDLSGDAMLVGTDVHVSGVIGRDVYARGDHVAINAMLLRDLVIHGDDLEVGEYASIGRDLHAAVDDSDDLVVEAGASIGGTTDIDIDEMDDGNRFNNIGFYLRKLITLTAGLLFGLVAFALVPNLFKAPRQQTEQHRWPRVLGIGIAGLILIPIAAVLVAVTLIGLPLAMVAIAGYALALYLGQLFIAAELGRRILRLSGDRASEVVWSLLLGMLVVAVLVELPVVGGILGFTLAVLGLGTVVNSLLSWNRRRKAQPAG